MTPTDLSRLEALAREATPGEWLTLAPGEIYVVDENRYKRLIAGTYRNSHRDANAAYIAAANPAAVLALIERVRELEGKLEALLPRRDRIVWPLPDDPDPYAPSVGRGLQPIDREDT